MKNKLFSPARKEAGFTLIELLTVIVIIGILAAIAIPVFTSQRARAQDSQTVSDVRNAAIAAESFLVDKNNKFSDLSKANIEFASSKNVSWDIKGSDSLGGYCIAAKNTAGKKYATDATALTYDSLAGGVGKSGGACVGANIPVPSGSTAVGSLVVVAVDTTPVNFAATSASGRNGTTQTFTAPAAGTYKIEAWGAKGGDGTYSTVNNVGASGAYATGTIQLTAGQALKIRVGQMGSNGAPYAGGGGGGTFVMDSTLTNPLVVAGGGGGGSYGGGGSSPASAGNTSTAGINANGSAGGVNGNGGAGGYAAGGAGYLTNGNYGSSSNINMVGVTIANGSAGGFAGTTCGQPGGDGGFGGGGGGNCGEGGGGGGYSGGAGSASNNFGGGGGGSYVVSTLNGVSTTAVETNNSTKANATAGKVVITRVS